MKYFLKRYSFLVIAQTVCLALGIWLEHSFVASMSNTDNQGRNIAAAVDGATASNASQKDAAIASASNGAPQQEIPVVAVTAIAIVWIAVIQAVVAYFVLMRDQEETARKHQQVEKVSMQQYNELLRTRDAVIFGLAKLAESRDPDTGKHLERIAIYSTRLATAARHEPCYREQITPSFIKLIGISSALHDIGKVGVQDSILLKPGRLEQQERLMVQMHSAIGGKCIREIESRLGRSNFLKMAREIAFGHHEHWDGAGYPKGLAGEDIPLAARIVAIADVYDALYTKRIYKEAYPHKMCVEMIREGAGKQFDPALVNIFLKLEAEFNEIARSCRDAAEDLNPEPASDEDAANLAEAEIALDNKFLEIEAMLDQCAGDLPAAAESSVKMRGSKPAHRESPQHPVRLNPEIDLSNIESEPENVA